MKFNGKNTEKITFNKLEEIKIKSNHNLKIKHRSSKIFSW